MCGTTRRRARAADGEGVSDIWMLAVGPKRWRTVRGAKQMISWVRAVGGRRDVVLVMRRGPEDMNPPGFRSRQVSRQLKELWEVSARTLFDGAVITVFDGRRSPTGTMGAGCRMAVTESSRYAVPALRFGPSGDA